MNNLKGHITKIEVSGSLSLVSICINENITLKSIVIETPETALYLREGNSIQVLFKETEVVIGTLENHAISLQNRISGFVSEIAQGALISRVVVSSEVGNITAIISTNAIKQLEIHQDKKVMAMVKLNEIMLAEC